MNRALACLSAAAFGAAALFAQPYTENAKPARTLAEMEPVLEKVAAWDFSQSREPLYRFSEFLQARLGSSAELRQIEERLLRILAPGGTLAGRDFVCRQLRLIGTAASVPALSGMLLNPETSDMARYALEGIAGAAATDALRAALGKASGNVKVGIVNSLGQLRDTGSVPDLAALTTSPEGGISGAAIAALAAIGDHRALDALGAARGRSSGVRRLRASEAYLRCADRLAAGGDTAAALEAYRLLGAAAEPEAIRTTALDGLAAVAGKGALPELEKALRSPGLKMQSAAIRLLAGIPGKDVTDLLVRHLPKLSAAGQVRLLSALGERGDASARSAAAQAVRSGEPGVRTAALTALGQLGGAASVVVLANAAASAEGAERTAARESLYKLRGAEVEAAIVSGIASATGGARLELIRAAGERWLASAGTVLMGAARDPDPRVRRESLRALRNAAAPRDSRVLLDLMIATADDSDRREASRALASALKRSERPEIGPVTAAYGSAKDGEVRAALLEVMGQVSANQALPVLRNALDDSRPEIVRAAILSLSEWATPEPLPDLFAAARNGANPAHRVLALRGAIQLISTASNGPMSETVGLLGEAMQIATQPEEKRAILSMLANYPTEEALRIAESASGDSAVAREAENAIGRIQLGLRAQRR